MLKIDSIWLVQPLAIARGGGSPTPCDAFDWAEADFHPHGTGRTQIVAADTLVVCLETGTVSMKPKDPLGEIIFRDEHGIRPVCPFFELHATWEGDGKSCCGPLTRDILMQSGKRAADLEWCVEFCNSKAFHWTRAEGDRITARLEIQGDDCVPKTLLGCSSPGAPNPLVPEGKTVLLGNVQLTCPNKEFPEFRLRFTPGAGRAYGPANLRERLATLPTRLDGPNALPFMAELVERNKQWRNFSLPEERCFLNPNAAWPRYALFESVEDEIDPRLIEMIPQLQRLLTLQSHDSSELIRRVGGPDKDVRNLPPGLYANVTNPPRALESLGLIDDYGDGFITCTLQGVGVARARIVSGPPNFAPDRRPVVSLADGLADRTRRAEVRDPGWVSGENKEAADQEVQDMLNRAFETISLANLDAMNDYFRTENRNQALRGGTPYTPEQAEALLWSRQQLLSVDTMPLTAQARKRHRRNAAAVYFTSLVRASPDFVEKRVRVPAGPERMYDHKMPGLMRGFDRRPLHLTRRQYDLLKAWVAALR